MKALTLFLILAMVGCQTTIVREDPTGKNFPKVTGMSLDQKQWNLPKDFKEKSILLVGYKQKSQFDIDRWLIGLDMKKVKSPVYEVPTIKSWAAGLFSSRINSGMRKGIPDSLWKLVITVYDDADKIVQTIGNQYPLNAHVLVLDTKGRIIFFHNKGFSVAALNQLTKLLQ